MRLACWQASVRQEDGARRLARLAEIADRARSAGANLLVTPEMSLTGYRLGPAELARVAGEAGEFAGRAAQIAAEHGIALAYGFPEAVGERVCNTVHLVDEHGTVVAAYRKAHLYGPRERSAFSAGHDGVVQGSVAGTRVGLLICYDVEFPEAVRAHALAGTELLLVPSALARPWTFVAEVLVPARAFESQLYVAYVNWSGSDGEATGFCGLSRVADPHGRVQSAAGDGDELLLVDVERAEIEAARATTPYLRDRRPELYPQVVAEHAPDSPPGEAAGAAVERGPR